jgi:hypothetical protein
MIEAGMDSLKWLVAEQHRDDAEIFVPIGSNGFFIEGSEKARFDQQPVEACATISACLEVYRLTEEGQWLEEASGSSAGFSARTICRFRFTTQHRRLQRRPSSRPHQ